MKKNYSICLGITLATTVLLTGCSSLPEDSAAVKQTDQITSQAKEAAGSTLVEVASVYAEPSPDSEILTELPQGARVSTVIADREGWRHVSLGPINGWIEASKLDTGSNASAGKLPTIYKTDGRVNIRSKATTSSKKIGLYAKGTQVTALDMNSKKTWIKVHYKGKTGWVATQTLTRLPQAKYTLKSDSTLQTKAKGGSKISNLDRGQEVIHNGRTSGSSFQVLAGSKVGWVKSSVVTKSLSTKYRVKTFTWAHESAGGKAKTQLYKNQIVGASSSTTKKVKGASWSKVIIGFTERWVPTSKLAKVAKSMKTSTPTKVIAKYKAKRAATFRAAPNGTSTGKYSAGYVVGSPSKDFATSGGKKWLHVIHNGKHQWVEASLFAPTSNAARLGAPSTPKKPAPAPTKKPAATPKPPTSSPDLSSMTRTKWSDADYIAAIKNNISRYCKNVPVKLASTPGTYYATSHPKTIYISRADNPNPNWGNIKSVSLHECAHILQFTAYEGKLQNLDGDMDPLWPGKKNGVEFLADCMSDLMGGKREGTLPNGWTYWAGYGETCNATQNKAAQKILSGKALS